MPNKADVIVLVGPMGVGKSTVGKKLAKIVKVPFCDTDALVTDQVGPIDKYFEVHGEESFRQIEHEALVRALKSPGIIATGGGAVLLPQSQEALKNATVVYLSTDGKHMGSRLRKSSRPLIKNGLDDWKRIYEARKATYEKVADLEINTSGHPLSQTIAEIRERLSI
jgi:shikimate kinase